MSPAPFRLAAQALDEASFAPFGEIIGPRSRPPVTNRDLLARGLVRIEDPVTEDRIADFDVLDYWAPVAEISAETNCAAMTRWKPLGKPRAASWAGPVSDRGPVGDSPCIARCSAPHATTA